ncbi:Xaa-Pro peptidase family protein [uncultured Litoreibacter sp.]|uniref:M24 family metallopeptidase n=1 Tax=uncultured Litoreibacter sp. TaxID=1392394 RepID=UPI0026237D7F|nr:Xaa-Pro peptidase family protein [uncultured Litoreibacter sp.]
MRGFSEAEFHNRRDRAQDMMAKAGLAALLLTTEPELRYYSGFLTRFWESPTRPWFLILPDSGDPIAVIPSIGANLMSQTWIRDIRTWRAPDLGDDGVSLLRDTLHEVAAGGPIGLASGMESHVRAPLSTVLALQDTLHLTSDADITRRLRLTKSPAEIGKIRTACEIADRAFARVGEIARVGVPLEQVFRRFQMLCLEEGADWVPYLAGAAARDGYGDVISPATETPLAKNDVLMLDTGLVHDGYFCDFDRNFSVGPPTQLVAGTHSRLIEATEAAFDLCKPGATTAELFHAMDAICTGGAGGSGAGRLGHGLGMQLTEWPSIIPTDRTTLQPGMVLTLEPGIETLPGKMLVHEENIVITETGAEYLSRPAHPDILELRT